jgi:hypothetical protein
MQRKGFRRPYGMGDGEEVIVVKDTGRLGMSEQT